MSNKTHAIPISRKDTKGGLHQQQRIERALRSALQFNQYVQTASEDDIIQFCVEEAERLTESSIGFLHLVNPDQETISIKAWSKRTEHVCDVPDHNTHYPIQKAGVWADCLRFRRSVVHNDYKSLPHKKGMPEGHVQVTREAVVPVFEYDKIVAVIGVGNKKEDYDQTDIDQLQLLAENVWFAIQRKRAEHQSKNLLDQLEHKNQELQSIVYASSHDLRSPMVNLLGFSGELEAGCQQLIKLLKNDSMSEGCRNDIESVIKSDILESLEFIKASGRKMDVLLEGLLRISRVGTACLSIQKLDMLSLMNEITKVMDYEIKQLKANVVIGDLPDCLGDKNQINQVFTNLIDNALKYRVPDRPGKIEITGCIDKEMSIYTVSDNGLGIEHKNLRKIFELFCRLPSENNIKGEGIGLTMIQRILDRNDGRIWVESEPGTGSKFYVALPAVGQ